MGCLMMKHLNVKMAWNAALKSYIAAQTMSPPKLISNDLLFEQLGRKISKYFNQIDNKLLIRQENKNNQ